jgi:hypothetical protein
VETLRREATAGRFVSGLFYVALGGVVLFPPEAVGILDERLCRHLQCLTQASPDLATIVRSGRSEVDGYTRWEAPDDVSLAAVALAIGGGALSSFQTTVLLTVDETMDALLKAEHVKYRAPAG